MTDKNKKQPKTTITPREYARTRWVGQAALAGFFPRIRTGVCPCCSAKGNLIAGLCKPCYEVALEEAL